MTYREDFTLPAELMERVSKQGFDILPELIQVIINAAMQAERQQYLKAEPYQHTEEREGHANGYKPKTVHTRVGNITFAIPQVREGGFYPEALEKGLRSERALLLALAEMYVQGVSTRKVKAVTEKLCGVALSSTQVSHAAAQTQVSHEQENCAESSNCGILAEILRPKAADNKHREAEGENFYGKLSR